MSIPGELKGLFEIACRSQALVLITGPTGTGKTTIARKIHDQSNRSKKPFVTINLASLHEGTFESELFGYERGAFTGADCRRIGKLELAQGGTVFLDEVGELSPRLQARLLEFLQSKVIRPLGSNRDIHLDVRVIAATNRDLKSAVARNEFREDLYHRLQVITMRLKSISERADEFDSIVHSCLEELCRTNQRHLLRISSQVADFLESYNWPGNIRELRNVLEFAVLASQGPEIGIKDLPEWILPHYESDDYAKGNYFFGAAECDRPLDYESAMASFEKKFLLRALTQFSGRVNLTARKIGMNKTTLIRRMRHHGLSRITSII